MGFFLLMAAGNDSHEGDLLQRDARAARGSPDRCSSCSRIRRSSRGTVEEALRMFPAFAHFRRTATKDTELRRQEIKRGRQDRHVVRVLQPRRVALRGPGPLRRDAAIPSTRRSAPAAGTSASARRSRGWSCGSCSRRRSRAIRRWSSTASRPTSSPASSTSCARCPCGSARGPRAMAAYNVSGKVALVTGGARGIGFATAQALRARGASVVIVDLDQDASDAAAAQLGDESRARHRRRRDRPRRDAARRRDDGRALRRARRRDGQRRHRQHGRDAARDVGRELRPRRSTSTSWASRTRSRPRCRRSCAAAGTSSSSPRSTRS